MKLERALENPTARQVLKTLLERQYSEQDRKRAPLLKLDIQRVPEFGGRGKLGAADEAWEAIQAFVQAGLITMDRIRSHPGKADYECSPTVRLVQARADEACELLGISFAEDPWTAAWRAGCQEADWLLGDLSNLLANRQHRVGKRNPEQMLAAWRRVVTEPFHGLGLREVSAQVFWGLSKELDDRYDLVALLRAGHGLAPLPELPLLLPVFLSESWRENGVLFVENLTAYAACVRGRVVPARGYAIVYCSGYKSAARRLRQADMALISFDATGDRATEKEFLAWLQGSNEEVKTFFWGDLDYAGMAILRELAAVFPGTQAWKPGYEPMVAALQSGPGHLPEEAAKERQEDPGLTGCQYADEVLRPALHRTGLFYDQEGVLAKHSLGDSPSQLSSAVPAV